MSNSSDIIYKIRDILEKINDIDQDIRFMSFNDLSTYLSNPEFTPVFQTQAPLTTNIANGIVTRLNDNISEVQNQAIKWYVQLLFWLSSIFSNIDFFF